MDKKTRLFVVEKSINDLDSILGALVLLKVVDTLRIESLPRSLFNIDLLAVTLI
jgi:hypothetical protein